jgi:hypothetical protein
MMNVDKRTDLCNAALKQASIEKAAAVIVMAGVYERTSFKYGERAERYVHIEVGSIAENGLFTRDDIRDRDGDYRGFQ